MSIRNTVDKFLSDPALSSQYNLNSYHREILRVIARYCDMQLHYCCKNQYDLSIECGIGYRKCKDVIAELSQKTYMKNKKQMKGLNLIYTTGHGKGNRYVIGESITGISNE